MAFPLNRRQLLGAGLAAAIPSAHAFIPVKVPQKWDDTVDVLCVGTGFSGLAAAIEPENRGIYTQSDSPKKSSRNIWSLAVVSVDQRY